MPDLLVSIVSRVIRWRVTGESRSLVQNAVSKRFATRPCHRSEYFPDFARQSELFPDELSAIQGRRKAQRIPHRAPPEVQNYVRIGIFFIKSEFRRPRSETQPKVMLRCETSSKIDQDPQRVTLATGGVHGQDAVAYKGRLTGPGGNVSVARAVIRSITNHSCGSAGHFRGRCAAGPCLPHDRALLVGAAWRGRNRRGPRACWRARHGARRGDLCLVGVGEINDSRGTGRSLPNIVHRSRPGHPW